jgi:hypothetical protein
MWGAIIAAATLLAALAVRFALPAVGSPISARRTLCLSNLLQVHYACDLYAKDNADAFPPDLAHLIGNYVTNARLFVCPVVGHDGHVADPGHRNVFVPEAVCYAYVSGLRASDDTEFVIAFDEERNHGREGIIVADIGGRVMWTPDIEAFHAKLEKQQVTLAAEGREMRVIRPTWSRWPGPPEYPVRPWHERWGGIALLAVAGLALAGGAVAFVLSRRRTARASSAGG